MEEAGERLREEKKWLTKWRKSSEKKEERLKRKNKFLERRQRWRTETKELEFLSETIEYLYRQTELAPPLPIEPPIAQITAEVAGGRIWSVPAFLDDVEDEISQSLCTGAELNITPEVFDMWRSINTAIREERLILSWITERADFFNRVDSRIELQEKGRAGKTGLWEEVVAKHGELNTLSKTNIYTREAILAYVNGPQNTWINRLFSNLTVSQDNRIKELVAEGLSTNKDKFIEQLGTVKKSVPGQLLLKDILEKKIVKRIMKTAKKKINPSTGEMS